MKEITEKLVNIQSELKAPKSQRNTFGNYNYRNAEDILEAVKPLLRSAGLMLYMSDEVVMLGNRYYVRATVGVSMGDEKVEVSAMAREEETKKGMDGSQITGASSSYARKYALNGLFAIDDNKDSDTTNQHGKEATTAPPPAQQKQSAPNTKQEKQRPAEPVELMPETELWEKVVNFLVSKKKTEQDWVQLRSNYKISDDDERFLFKTMDWLPF